MLDSLSKEDVGVSKPSIFSYHCIDLLACGKKSGHLLISDVKIIVKNKVCVWSNLNFTFFYWVNICFINGHAHRLDNCDLRIIVYPLMDGQIFDMPFIAHSGQVFLYFFFLFSLVYCCAEMHIGWLCNASSHPHYTYLKIIFVEFPNVQDKLILNDKADYSLWKG